MNNVILSVAKDLPASKTFNRCVDFETLHFVQDDKQ